MDKMDSEKGMAAMTRGACNKAMDKVFSKYLYVGTSSITLPLVSVKRNGLSLELVGKLFHGQTQARLRDGVPRTSNGSYLAADGATTNFHPSSFIAAAPS